MSTERKTASILPVPESIYYHYICWVQWLKWLYQHGKIGWAIDGADRYPDKMEIRYLQPPPKA